MIGADRRALGVDPGPAEPGATTGTSALARARAELELTDEVIGHRLRHGLYVLACGDGVRFEAHVLDKSGEDDLVYSDPASVCAHLLRSSACDRNEVSRARQLRRRPEWVGPVAATTGTSALAPIAVEVEVHQCEFPLLIVR